MVINGQVVPVCLPAAVEPMRASQRQATCDLRQVGTLAESPGRFSAPNKRSFALGQESRPLPSRAQLFPVEAQRWLPSHSSPFLHGAHGHTFPATATKLFLNPFGWGLFAFQSVQFGLDRRKSTKEKLASFHNRKRRNDEDFCRSDFWNFSCVSLVLASLHLKRFSSRATSCPLFHTRQTGRIHFR